MAVIAVAAMAMMCFWGDMVSTVKAEGTTITTIEKNISSIRRAIPTSSSKAEKAWIETDTLLKGLESSDSGNPEVIKLRDSMEKLAKQLERRLRRPIGGVAAEPEKETVVEKETPKSSELSSAVTSRLKRMYNDLAAVESAIEKDRLQTAKTKMKSAEKIMEEIQSRYGSKIPAGNKEMAEANARLTAVSDKMKQASEAAEAASAKKDKEKELKQAQSQEWIDKFSPFFEHGNDSYLRIGSDFNSASKEEQAMCREAYARANKLMAEYRATEFPHGKTQALQFMEPRLEDTLRYFNEGEARDRQEEACSEWVNKLRQYVDVGAGSSKYLITGITLSESNISQREKLYNEANTVWKEYQNATFPLGKTLKLLDLEKDMKEILAVMPEDLRKSRAMVAGDLTGELDRILNHLNKDTGWKSDKTKLPNLAMERDIKPMEEAVERYAKTVNSNNGTLAELKAKLAEIRDTDVKNRKIRSDRTFMLPERYNGPDAGDLRTTVTNIVSEKAGKCIRVTLCADGWKEEDVLEWTDTTKSVVRHRITRFMTVQAASKNSDGRVYLNGVHLAKDRKSDGSWGELYGHIMWSDWMAEGNVNK